MKKLLLLFSILIAGFGMQRVSAQTLDANPSTICLGGTTTVTVNGLTVPYTKIEFDFGDGTPIAVATPPSTSNNHGYSSSGAKTITATIYLTGGGTQVLTKGVNVVQPPTASINLQTSAIQCFIGNVTTLQNTSIPGSSPISTMTIDWGDVTGTTVNNPTTGQTFSHNYTFMNTFTITVTVTDASGCASQQLTQLVTIKQDLTPSFNIVGSRGCMKSCYSFVNTTPVAFSDLQTFTWDFGDGTSLTAQRPFVMPKDSIDYYNIIQQQGATVPPMCYTKPGTFFPSLYIKDVTGCEGKYTAGANDNPPQNIFFEFDITPTYNNADTLPRADSVCFGTPHDGVIFFRQTPIELADQGDWLWTFDNPITAPPGNNINPGTSWWPGHQFLRDLPQAPPLYHDKCDYNVKLRVFVTPCDTTDSIWVRIAGPKARIENKPSVVIDPTQKTQCVINNLVEFPNTSSYCYANNVWTKWDFGDDFAPRCTSFLVPRAGFPPPGGWVYNQNPPQALNNSDGYFIQNGITYAGKRVDCNYSHDSLPVHKYEDWAKIYLWYLDGHDFMPWDTTRYTRNPADTGSAPGSKFWVNDRDALFWGKPIYLNPGTGEMDTIQRPYNDPIFGNILFPRIDTIEAQQPQDLVPLNRIVIQRGTPDPFALDEGVYNIIPIGTVIDPKNQPNGLSYFANGRVYNYPYSKRLNGQSSTLNFHEYVFYREIQKCHTVELELSDSSNNGSTGMPQSPTDFMVIDTADCGHKANVQLALVRPDARGLGKSGKECTGAYNPEGTNGNGIQFRLDAAIYEDFFTKKQSRYPGINPNCGQSYILLNTDSLADRLDATPCTLDGFVSFGGGTTPGGLSRPAFNTTADWRGIPWLTPDGTSTWWHYGPNAPLNAAAPADANGYVTVGLVIGAGSVGNPPQPLCISDTVWYHNFLFFRKANAEFYLDPTYNPVTKAPTTGICKEYCKNDQILFVYADTTQDSVAVSYINWGDNSYTLDSFYYTKDTSAAATAQGFVKGLKRIRQHYHTGICGFDPPTLYKTEIFPYGVPGLKVDTVWHQNYYHRIYNPSTNPYGSLDTLGRNLTGDSMLINECNIQYWMALTDTLKNWYIMEIRDSAYGMWPLTHQFWSSTFENGCKQTGIAGTGIAHDIYTTKGCKSGEARGLVIRGTIDTCMVRNSDLEFDTIFCVGEPVHFYDSVRYWRPDCSISALPFNPNLDWRQPGNPPALGGLFALYQFDTTDYWELEKANQNVFRQPSTATNPYIEKMYWDFGDGQTATGTKPIHKYKNPGRYIVTMTTFDRMGCWDTSWCYVNVSDPVAKITPKPGALNCGVPVEMWDRSTVNTGGHDNADSIKTNYWWFGERKTADTLTRFDGSNTDTAVWSQYRKNGYQVVKLVVETFQGCKDTTWQQIFIDGPRPKIKIITDTVGCAPFKVKVINLADTDGPPTAPKLTKATFVEWGTTPPQQSEIMLNQYDTVEFVYNDSGTYYIFAKGDDDNPPSSATLCPIITFPDTAENFEAPMRIVVKHSYPAKLEVNPQLVCVDQPFEVTNLSDTISYTQFKYYIYTGDTLTIIDSVEKTNLENKFQMSIDSMGRFLVLIEPTGYAPGLPPCKRWDTVEVNVVEPIADFDIDTLAPNRRKPEFMFKNKSLNADNYTWTAYKGTDFSVVYLTEDKLQANPDWYIDFQKDTGDYIVCLTAFTPDPAKPICSDSVCKKIDFRFVENLEMFNVFTPNNDGSNDVFNIEIEGELEYDLVIYNRWGTKVFESKDKQLDWNGKNFNSGSECPAGTYYYVFKYKLQSGKEETVNGSITLIRQQ